MDFLQTVRFYRYTITMNQAARAIIIENDRMLVMHRNKEGSEYFTLVGGKVATGETVEQALVREVKEETGLQVIAARRVFSENHPEPYNKQYIYLCEIGPHQEIAIQDASEEAILNKLSIDVHTPYWVTFGAFSRLQFRTPQLQAAIVAALQNDFPSQEIAI